MIKPKFEKVNDNVIRIIVERAEDVPLVKLVENRAKLLEQKKTIEQTLKNLDEILAEAKKLGIVAKEKGGAPRPKPQPKPRHETDLCKACHKNPATRDGECVDCSH